MSLPEKAGALPGQPTAVVPAAAADAGAGKKLLLWDIDGTLLASGGAGERALRAAVLERFGNDEAMRIVEIAGRTDTRIAHQVLRFYERELTPGNVTQFLETYLRYLGEMLPITSGRLLPGIVPLLETLRQRNDVLLGLLTGNLLRGAELKLRQYGIWGYFPLGAFADDHHERNELGPFATRRVREQHGFEIPGERIFVIGDTPHDIACGKAIGAKTVAVATGIFTRTQLEECAPDWVFDDFADWEAAASIFSELPIA